MEFLKRWFMGQYRFYVITTSIMLAWMFLLDSNDLGVQIRLSRELYHLRSEKKYYQEQLKVLAKERRMMMGNAALLEKYAREKYLMKRPKEDVYIIVDDQNNGIE
jgi:cell division protein FtsB